MIEEQEAAGLLKDDIKKKVRVFDTYDAHALMAPETNFGTLRPELK
jgi:hypothetical protein